MTGRWWPITRALAVTAALAWLTTYLLGLPGAVPIDQGRSPVAYTGERWMLKGVTGPILTVASTPGASVAVNANDAALTDETRTGLAELGQTVPAGSGPLSWIDLGSGDGAVVTFTVTPVAGTADIAIERTSDQQNVELRLTAHRGRLEINAVAPYAKGPAADTELHVGTQTIVQRGGGAFPTSITVPDGAQAAIRLSSAAAAASQFMLGTQAPDGSGARLTMASATIGNEDGRRAVYCGAPQGAVLWRTTDLDRASCVRVLHASHLTTASGVGIDLFGSSYQSSDGVVAAAPIIARISDNKVLTVFLGLCYTAVATWLFRTLFPKAD